MRYQEILEACWTGYQQQGMKKKGDRRVPNCVPVEEAVDTFLDNSARELLGLVIIAGGAFAVGTYYTIVNKLKKYQGRQIVDALERKGVKFNRATYEKIKPLLDQFRQALRDSDGEQAKELANRIEQMIVMGKLSATEPQTQDTASATKERELAEDLKKWVKEKWVRFGPDGKIRGDCARGSESEGKPKCLPQSKAQSLGKKGRASAAAKKRREDPNPERRGAAKNVATKVKEENQNDRNARIIAGEIEDAMSQGNEKVAQEKIKQLIGVGYTLDKHGRLQRLGMYEEEVAEGWLKPVSFTPDIIAALKTQRYKGPYKLSQLKKWYKELNGFEGIDADDDIMVQGNDIDYDGWVIPFGGKFLMGAEHMVGPASAKEILKLDEEQDACYRKVKSRYKVWPSAYASGALVQCRKKGASNWGNKGSNKK